MKKYRRLPNALVIVIAVVLAVVTVTGLYRWTEKIRSRQRQEDLKSAMTEIVGQYGERALLEMAGVPVNNIYYGDSGITLFQGDSASWTYSSEEIMNIAVFRKCENAVVHITAEGSSTVSDMLEGSSSSGVGSGFFISYDGYILTNVHVIEGSSVIRVRTSDDEIYEASVVGKDTENDIAVLKITPKESNRYFEYLEFADSSSLVVGQKVLAIGNPFGYDRSMVTGIISGLSRPIRDEKGNVLLGMIQTDAPLNPGNSGGPLLNTQGLVIGVNTSIYSSNSSFQGLSFAVSANTAKTSSQELIKYGKVSRGWIDVLTVPLTEEIVKYSSLKVSKGLLVSQTVPSGKAEKAGLKAGSEMVRYGNSVIYLGGDVITEVNGYTVCEYSDLYTALSQTKPGDKVEVVVNRSGQTVRLRVELTERQ